MRHARTNPFNASVATADRTERIGSAIALIVLLCSWIVAYPIACPPDAAAHHLHVAQVRL